MKELDSSIASPEGVTGINMHLRTLKKVGKATTTGGSRSKLSVMRSSQSMQNLNY